MDEKSFASILRGFFLMGLFAYILPVLAVCGGFTGLGVFIGWLLWGGS